MKAIIKERNEGKTLELIKIAAEQGLYIIVRNQEMAYYTKELAEKKGFQILFPITYSEFDRKAYYGKNIKGFLFDDLDNYIQMRSPNVRIFAFTASNESIYFPKSEPIFFATNYKNKKF